MFSEITKVSILSILAFGITSCETVSDQDGNGAVSDTTEVAASHFPLSSLDTTVSPCEDFYQFAAGGWLKNNPVPSTESRWSSFNVLNDSNETKQKSILEEFAAKEDAPKGSMEQLLGDFYESAMDSASANEKGLKPLVEQIKKIEAISSKDEYIKTSAELSKIGVGSMFGIYIGQDDKNSDQYITHIYQSGLGLPDKDYYLKTDEKSKEIREQYIDHISKMFVLSGEDQNTAKSKAETIMAIETDLAEVSMSRVDRRDPLKTYNKRTFEELKKSSPNFKWELYFGAVGTQPDSFVVTQPDFLKSANMQFSKIPLEDLKTYMKWNLVNSYAHYLDSAIANQNFDFYSKTLSGKKEMKPRWNRALDMVNANLGELLGKAFVERHFSEEAKADVREMVENLRSVFKERINQLSWMGDSTKAKAIRKLEAFNMKIGYPDEWKDFSKLEISDSTLVKNVMNARKFKFEYMISKLGGPVDENEWFMTPQTVNAYYSSSQNEIVFPAGILQAPFYNVEADDALNYGGIGAVIGHEFTHGFDDQGSKYDHAGNLENWWTEEDRSMFEKRANFVVEQFNLFEPLDSLFINGKLTLGENIADLGGLTLAYYALEKEVGENPPAEIDGFTYQQRFFLGWAQVWHMNITDEALRQRLLTDPHSPGKFRVNGPLSNMDEFSKAFGCEANDRMVQTDSIRAVIW